MPCLFVPADIAGYSTAGFIAALVIIKVYKPSKLGVIPTVGSYSWLGSWWASFTFVTNALEIIQDGYQNHKIAPFKVSALLNGWIVNLNNPRHVDELSSAPADTLSYLEAMNVELQVEYTMDKRIHNNEATL